MKEWQLQLEAKSTDQLIQSVIQQQQLIVIELHLQQFKGQKGNLKLQQRRLRENDGKGWGHRK